jgi:ketosteroid isomerase-like protein
MIGEGDVVWIEARLETTRRRDRTQHSIDVAARWQFREGRIVRIDEYYDSASLLMREGRLVMATGS